MGDVVELSKRFKGNSIKPENFKIVEIVRVPKCNLYQIQLSKDAESDAAAIIIHIPLIRINGDDLNRGDMISVYFSDDEEVSLHGNIVCRNVDTVRLVKDKPTQTGVVLKF